MQHLACVLHPREHGLTPYRVVFRRAQSHPVRSMLDDGLWYTAPGAGGNRHRLGPGRGVDR